jgi:hypothetical protein
MAIETDYSFSEKLLHRIALGSKFVGRLSFDLEKLISNTKQLESTTEQHVFIGGLARAGTTIMMRAFYDSGHFRSLTYRDMPFVLMPGIWKKITQPFYHHIDEKERAHGDGVFINYDSPEAFEEVFWMVFCANEYVNNHQLIPHLVSDETIEEFKLFVGHVIASGDFSEKQRYLSKNNNNILRLGAIRKAFPAALIIVPYRSPLQHAFSLYQQHLRFSKQHDIDAFSSDYMRWLGHFEFGENHKPFNCSGGNSLLSFEPNDLNYWLVVWIDVYRYLLKSSPIGTRFIAFEQLCISPDTVLGDLFESAGIAFDVSRESKKIKPQKNINVDNASKELTTEALEIYQELLSRI